MFIIFCIDEEDSKNMILTSEETNLSSYLCLEENQHVEGNQSRRKQNEFNMKRPNEGLSVPGIKSGF